MTDLALKPSDAGEFLRACIAARQPACLWGIPGVGKSDLVKQVAADLGMAMVDIRVGLLDPVDLRGIPAAGPDGRTVWLTPEFLPRDGRGVLFLDELNRGAQSVQNACLQLVRFPHRLGEYQLPDGWTIAAACNLAGAGVQAMSDALAGRFIHATVAPDVNDWCKWAAGAGIEPATIAFIRFRPELLSVPLARGEKAGPSPRTWEFVSRVTGQPSVSVSVERALYAGAVGEGPAIEYLSFLGLYRTLPSLDAILLNPAAAPVPSDVATLYALAAALAHRSDANNLGRVLTYLDRLPAEFAVFSVRDATTRDPSLTATREFILWGATHSHQL